MADPMDEDEYQAFVRDALDDAADWCDALAREREEATSYYYGRPFDEPPDGRSSVVMSEVRDVVRGVLPSLLRIFAGAEQAAEFAPVGPEDEAVAAAQTEAVNDAFYNKNPGFRVLHDALKDGCVRRLGIVTWRWEERARPFVRRFQGVTGDALAVMAAEEGATDLTHRPAGIGEDGSPLFDVTVKGKRAVARAVVEAVPPDEFLVDRWARSEDDCEVIGRRRIVTVSDLVAMGFPRAEVEEHAGSGAPDNARAWGRRKAGGDDGTTWRGIRDRGGALREVEMFDVIVRADRDGDGIAETRRIVAIGDARHILSDEEMDPDDVNYATFCPDPESHSMFGQSVADLAMDLQRIRSAVVRGMLDSLYVSLNPQRAVVEGQVNMDDVLNPEIGAILREKNPGMIRDLTVPFVGGDTLPVLAYFDAVRQQRTGVSVATGGLDPDALRNVSATGVNEMGRASREQIEMIARVAAEGFIRRIFRGLLRLLSVHGGGGEGWNVERDVTVQVGLGRGTEGERLNTLGAIAMKQEAILSTAGPGNPMVGFAEYRETLAEMAKLGGYKNPDRFFREVKEGEGMPEPAAPAPDPQMVAMQMQGEIERAKLALEERKMVMADDRERDKAEADVIVRLAEAQMKAGVAVNVAETQAMIRARADVARAAARPIAPDGGAP